VLDPETPTFALDVLSFVEAILENPGVVLEAQARKARDVLFHKLKMEGVEFEQRQQELEKVTYPKPNEALIYDTFNTYSSKHPWLENENIRPKSVMRDMYEQYLSFNEYVREYGIARAEGVLLRYLTDAYKTLVQTVPERDWNDDLVDVAAYMRATLGRVDASLLAEWESLRDGEGIEDEAAGIDQQRAVLLNPKMLRARIRQELHMFVKALAARDYEEAAGCVADDSDPEGAEGAESTWTPEKLEAALAPFYAEHSAIVFDHRARNAQLTLVEEDAPKQLRVRQVLVDSEDENTWYLEGRIDLRKGLPEGPLLKLTQIGS